MVFALLTAWSLLRESGVVRSSSSISSSYFLFSPLPIAIFFLHKLMLFHFLLLVLILISGKGLLEILKEVTHSRAFSFKLSQTKTPVGKRILSFHMIQTIKTLYLVMMDLYLHSN